MKNTVLFAVIACLLFCFSSLSAKTEIPEEEIDNSIVIDRITNDDVDVILPVMIWTFSDAEVTVRFRNTNHTKLLLNKNVVEFIINGEPKQLTFVDGKASFFHRFDGSRKLNIYAEEFSYSTTVTAYPLWAILVPLAFLGLLVGIRMVRRKA